MFTTHMYIYIFQISYTVHDFLIEWRKPWELHTNLLLKVAIEEGRKRECKDEMRETTSTNTEKLGEGQNRVGKYLRATMILGSLIIAYLYISDSAKQCYAMLCFAMLNNAIQLYSRV